MSLPPPGKTKNGRCNVSNIPYLYLAVDTKTAIAEVKPWKDSIVCVAKFNLIMDARFINITTDTYSEEYTIEQIRRKLNEEFSKPIHRYYEDIYYIPSQYISELIKTYGYDGIIYGSAMDSRVESKNLVIFKDNLVLCSGEVISYKIKNILHEYDNIK